MSASGQFHRFVHPLGNGIIYKRFQRLSARSRAILTHSLINPGKESRLLISRGRTTSKYFARQRWISPSVQKGTEFSSSLPSLIFFFFLHELHSFSYITIKPDPGESCDVKCRDESAYFGFRIAFRKISIVFQLYDPLKSSVSTTCRTICDTNRENSFLPYLF